jgi:hypothetical protein
LPIEISGLMKKRRKQDPEGQTVARNGFPVPAGETSSMPLRADELSCRGAGIQRSGGAPGIRGTPAGRLLSRAQEKVSATEGKSRKNS